MRDFKFLSDNEDNNIEWDWDNLQPRPIYDDEDYVLLDEYVGASWHFIEDDHNHFIMTEQHYGIRSFLNQFDNGRIIPVKSITGPNGFVHNINTEQEGWGFDILSDLITVEWFAPNL